MTRPFRIGLTGSIGMGKSTVASMFAEQDIELWDADSSVHRLYSKGGLAVEPIRGICASAIVGGGVDRDALKDWIATDTAAIDALNTVVHPLVRQDRAAFLAKAKTDLVVLDIPLLFETGAQTAVNFVVVVTARPEIQRQRLLQRATMTHNQLDLILARQMPDAEKRNRADQVVLSEDMTDTKQQVHQIVTSLRREL